MDLNEAVYVFFGINRIYYLDDQILQKRYKDLRIKNHPDNQGDEEEFKKIEDAYKILIQYAPEKLLKIINENNKYGPYLNLDSNEYASKKEKTYWDEIKRLLYEKYGYNDNQIDDIIVNIKPKRSHFLEVIINSVIDRCFKHRNFEECYNLYKRVYELFIEYYNDVIREQVLMGRLDILQNKELSIIISLINVLDVMDEMNKNGLLFINELDCSNNANGNITRYRMLKKEKEAKRDSAIFWNLIKVWDLPQNLLFDEFIMKNSVKKITCKNDPER